MKLSVLITPVLLLSPLAAASRAQVESGPTDHVVLISIDGLRPEFYLEREWPAPMIQQMAKEGTHARARGVYPSVTYPTHTSIITGAYPARHGIFNNSPFEPGGQTGRWYWETEAILAPTLWHSVRTAGLTSASLSWPVSVGGPIDWNLPEIWSITAEETAIDALRGASHPQGLWEEIEREATGRLTLDNFNNTWITRDDRAGDIAAYLLTTYRPNLMTVHLLGVDHFQHDDGRDSPRVRRALATVDTAISQMVEAAERVGMLERTTFIITGDHGFFDIEKRLAPNVWLGRAGLLDAERPGQNWRARFHTDAASAFLHLADADDQATLTEVLRLLEQLPAEQRALFEILDREQLDTLSATPEAALGLALAPGVDTSSSAQPPVVAARGGANHGYLPDYPELHTGFIAWGAGIEGSGGIAQIDVVDIAPLVAQLLRLDFTAPDGEVPAELRIGASNAAGSLAPEDSVEVEVASLPVGVEASDPVEPE